MNSNMESNSNKVAGTINTTVGSVKEEAGKFSGNQNMEAEGAIQKTKGRAQKFSGAIQDAIKKGQTLLGMKPKNF